MGFDAVTFAEKYAVGVKYRLRNDPELLHQVCSQIAALTVSAEAPDEESGQPLPIAELHGLLAKSGMLAIELVNQVSAAAQTPSQEWSVEGASLAVVGVFVDTRDQLYDGSTS